MGAALGHLLFAPRVELSIAGLSGVFWVGWWVRVFAEWLTRRRANRATGGGRAT